MHLGQKVAAIQDECTLNHCTDCDACAEKTTLHLVAADYGEGAFLKILCQVCDHRRWYRAELRRRRQLLKV